MTDLDPAEVMAEHENHPDPAYGVGWCHECRTTEWPCLPYLLAKDLTEARRRAQRLREFADSHARLAALPTREGYPIMVPAFAVAEDLLAILTGSRVAAQLGTYPVDSAP
jgi:hypothetical protein